MGVDHPGLSMSMGDLIRTVRRIARQTIQNASIGRAGIRVYDGGRILFEQGGGVEIRDDGFIIIDGDLTGNGNLNWTGFWRFISAAGGEIDGDVALKGNFDLTGKLTSAGIRIEGGKIYAGTGTKQVVIDGTTGRVTIGGMKIDPNDHDGMITLPNGGQVLAEGNATEVWSPGPVRRGISLRPDSIHVFGANVATSTAGLDWLAVNAGGELFTVDLSTGGPGGQLAWPFPPSTVTSEYGPREAPGEGASTFHEGIDFGIGEGTPIPAAGPGTVTAAGYHSGFGNRVVIDHGGGLQTLCAHMRDTPPVSVGDHIARGQTIGLVGNTGISFGAHLHLEVHVDGVTVNPRTKLPATA